MDYGYPNGDQMMDNMYVNLICRGIILQQLLQSKQIERIELYCIFVAILVKIV